MASDRVWHIEDLCAILNQKDEQFIIMSLFKIQLKKADLMADEVERLIEERKYTEAGKMYEMAKSALNNMNATLAKYPHIKQ